MAFSTLDHWHYNGGSLKAVNYFSKFWIIMLLCFLSYFYSIFNQLHLEKSVLKIAGMKIFAQSGRGSLVESKNNKSGLHLLASIRHLGKRESVSSFLFVPLWAKMYIRAFFHTLYFYIVFCPNAIGCFSAVKKKKKYTTKFNGTGWILL